MITCLQTAPDTAFALAYQNNRLSRITYPDGAMRQFGYNAVGLLTALTDRTGHTRQYVRDELDGKLLAVVDEKGHSTQFVFDDRRLTGIVFPDGTQQTVAYDETDDSLFITFRDGKGFIQQYDGDFISELNWEHGPWTRFVNDADGRPKIT